MISEESQKIHDRLKLCGVKTYNLLFKMYPSELLLEALAARFLDDRSFGGWESKHTVGQNGTDIYSISGSIGWTYFEVNASSRLEALTLACEKFVDDERN